MINANFRPQVRSSWGLNSDGSVSFGLGGGLSVDTKGRTSYDVGGTSFRSDGTVGFNIGGTRINSDGTTSFDFGKH